MSKSLNQILCKWDTNERFYHDCIRFSLLKRTPSSRTVPKHQRWRKRSERNKGENLLHVQKTSLLTHLRTYAGNDRLRNSLSNPNKNFNLTDGGNWSRKSHHTMQEATQMRNIKIYKIYNSSFWSWIRLCKLFIPNIINYNWVGTHQIFAWFINLGGLVKVVACYIGTLTVRILAHISKPIPFAVPMRMMAVGVELMPPKSHNERRSVVLAFQASCKRVVTILHAKKKKLDMVAFSPRSET